jgi:hypothetical protein
MNQTFVLKTVDLLGGDDGQHVRVDWGGQKGEIAKIEMTSQGLDDVIEFLITKSTQLRVSSTLPAQNPQTELPAQDHALLVATDVNAVPFEGGGFVLQFQTVHGVGLQIGLNAEQTDFLRASLSATSPPPSAS